MIDNSEQMKDLKHRLDRAESAEEIAEICRLEAKLMDSPLNNRRSSMATVIHDSDCAIHNAPALPAGPCDCGATSHQETFEALAASERDLTHALRQRDDARAILNQIAGAHLGDCPASMEEVTFARAHIQTLRKLANDFLVGKPKDQ